MRIRDIAVPGAVAATALVVTLAVVGSEGPRHDPWAHAAARGAVAFDTSRPLASMRDTPGIAAFVDAPEVAGDFPADRDDVVGDAPAADANLAAPGGERVEQRTMGRRPALPVLASFDGLGAGFVGPQGSRRFNNPSDNALAVGPNHIVQIVNGGMAVFTKKGVLFDTTGKVIYGPVISNAIFKGFGGACEANSSGDAVVRYDQLADRWLYVLPVFRRGTTPPVELTRESHPGQPGQPGEAGPTGLITTPPVPPAPPPPPGARGGQRGGRGPGGVRPLPPPSANPYSMCYAVSTSADPLGPYFRYEFFRPLFPDYPRPAIWTDGYYVPTSTSDNFIQKQACVAEREKMLQGLPAREQCIIIDGVSFLNNADIEGHALPPAGAPNIMMAAGGEQLHQIFEDDGIYAWQFHVDWNDPSKTALRGPSKITVAPYHFLCNGQLTNCVPQPDTNRRLDAQGDKLMQRLVYRRIDGHQSIVAVHSVNTAERGGGVRWYEFRLDSIGVPVLYQQGTYAPDALYRWLPSPDIDRRGNIGIGYSFGGGAHFPGQRFAARRAGDPLGQLTYHESVLAEGEASQKGPSRWEDYTTTAMDPSDDCTFWYVGDYVRRDSTGYSSRIGAFRVPGCLQGTIAGSVFYDANHDGLRDGGEPGLPGRPVRIAGAHTATLVTDRNGAYTITLNSDPAYGGVDYDLTAAAPSGAAWIETRPSTTPAGVTTSDHGFRVHLGNDDFVTAAAFGRVCVMRGGGAAPASFWLGDAARTVMQHRDSNWTRLFDSIFVADSHGEGIRVPRGPAGFDSLRDWLGPALRGNDVEKESAAIAVAGLNVVAGRVDGSATVADPVQHDWPKLWQFLGRASVALRTGATTVPQYQAIVDALDDNTARVSPPGPAGCGGQR